MEAPTGESNPPLQHPGPVRILVQTVTNLVPGNDYGQRVEYIRNLICQHHWNRDFDWNKDRWNVYGDQFGYENRKCYFLVDHGESTENPPILWYQWTGKSLIAIQQSLPEEIQSRLEKYPFTKSPIQRPRKPTPGQPDAKTHRRTIQSKLRYDMIITDGDIDFLATHPEDATWLKDHIEAQLWSKIHSLMESRQGKGSVYADGERTLTNSATPEP